MLLQSRSYTNKKAYGQGLYRTIAVCFLFYLVRGTSSLWSIVTDEDLLSTEGVKVTKASVLLVGEQAKSGPAGLVEMPLD